MTTIIPLEKLEQLRKEQRRESELEQRPALYAPEPPIEMLTGSMPQQEREERGIAIIDFTI
jgi:hypothetical protein